MDKYSSFKQPTSPLKKFSESELDPYSPVIVEDLLQGLNEWRNIQDIIRLTFKALTDVVKAQGDAIREIEKTMPTRASKTELNSALALKANNSDVTRTVNEIVSSLEGKISFEDAQALLRDYTTKTDLQYQLSHKISVEEIKGLLETKVSTHEFKNELINLDNKIDDFNRDSNKKISGVATQKDIQTILESLELKANMSDLQEGLESKANKQSVANALHRKANRSDVDQLLAKKADSSDVQQILQTIENKADVRTIDKLADIIDSKCDKQDISFIVTNLNAKIDKSDVDSLIRSTQYESEQRINEDMKKFESLKSELENLRFALNQALQKKADSKDFDKLNEVLNLKVDNDVFGDTLNSMKNEIYEDMVGLKSEISSYRAVFEESQQEKNHKFEIIKKSLTEEITILADRMKQFSEERRSDIEETAKFVKSVSSNLKKEIEKDLVRLIEDFDVLRKSVDENTLKKLDKKEFNDYKTKIVLQIDEKVDLLEVQNALNASQSDISARFIEYKDEIKTLIRNHENEMFNLLNKKANLSDVNVALNSKADNSIIQNILNSKIGAGDFENIAKTIDKILKEIDEKVGIREFTQRFSEAIGGIEELQRDIMLKANIKDVCTLLDTKSNIDDVNKALTEIHKELDIKSNVDEFNNYVNDQAVINESLCTENIVGRWTWKSGELKSGSTVPWEMQVVNTLPDNFLWEKEKTSILTVAPGLYEISFGFFARKKPSVQLLVNSEPILSAVNNASYVIHHSSGKLKDIKHPNGNITGLTMIDFIVLPARARISVTYSGEMGAEGFIGLRRL